MMSLVYYIGTCLNILCYCCNLHTTKTEHLWCIYYFITAALVWKGDLLVYNSFIFLFADLLIDTISKRLKIFTIYHHTLSIIFLINTYTGIVDTKLVELGLIQELSSVPLKLFHMGYISKPIYNLLFSYSFIFIRIICYNYFSYITYLTNRDIFNNSVLVFYTIMNITNIGIIWKMKLVQKLFAIRPAIDYLCDKQPKST
jgi:hypothetical protein